MEISLSIEIIGLLFSVLLLFITYRIFAFFRNFNIGNSLEILYVGFFLVTIQKFLGVLNQMNLFSISYLYESIGLLAIWVIIYGSFKLKIDFQEYKLEKEVIMKEITESEKRLQKTKRK